MFDSICKLKKQQMDTTWDDIKTVIAYIMLGFIGIIVFFLKGMFGQHKKMYDFYVNTQGKCEQHGDALADLDALRMNVTKVESESKSAYKELLIRIDSNHQLLMSKLDGAVKGYNQIDNKLDKLDRKIDMKKDK